MTTQKVKRKLAAILSADVKAYSRLMGEDEVATLKILSAYFQMKAFSKFLHKRTTSCQE